jgi:hypothetical protein
VEAGGVSVERQPSFRVILTAIRAVIDGREVPAEFVRQQEELRRTLPRRIFSHFFSLRTLIFTVCMVLFFNYVVQPIFRLLE